MPRRRVLFLYTGGTLGMRHRDPGPLAPSLVASDLLPYVRGLEDEVDVDAELLCNLDSTDLGPPEWARIAEGIATRLDRWDGFVVVHGTDTMAWTASALSFALSGLPKPVVLTGAQRPIALVRSDARQNLVSAALCAAMDIPEVSIAFGRCLFRGNRATKVSVQSYDAFESPGFPPLVELGVDVVQRVAPRRPAGPLEVRPDFAEVAVIPVVPGAGPRLVRAAVDAGYRGLVVRGFGSGNVPQADWPAALRAATDAGVFVALHSQCLRGSVDLHAYEGGRAALDAGAAGTGAMTLEAATVKLMWLLARGLRGEPLRDAYASDLAGEGAGSRVAPRVLPTPSTASPPG